MTARSPAERQAARRARGARSVTLSAEVMAQIDAVATRDGDPTRTATIARLVLEATGASGGP